MPEDNRWLEFVYSDGFLEDVDGLPDEAALQRLENDLIEDPRRGPSMAKTRGGALDA